MGLDGRSRYGPRVRFALALSFAALTSSLAARATAFCRTTSDGAFVPSAARPCDDKGDPLFWATRCVGFSVQRSASVQVPLPTARALVAEAFAQWSAASCLATLGPACSGAPKGPPSLTARDLGPVDCADVEYVQNAPNANVIVFRDGVWPNDGVALALTTVTYKIDGGQIYDADVEVQSNPAVVKLGVTDPIAPDGYDLRSILTHEVGHFLGLAHTQPSNPEATMFERYRDGQTLMRDLSSDDACGLCNAYPPDRAAACAPAPNGGLGNLCGGADARRDGCGCSAPGATQDVGSSAGATVVLVVVWAARRRRR